MFIATYNVVDGLHCTYMGLCQVQLYVRPDTDAVFVGIMHVPHIGEFCESSFAECGAEGNIIEKRAVIHVVHLPLYLIKIANDHRDVNGYLLARRQ